MKRYSTNLIYLYFCANLPTQGGIDDSIMKDIGHKEILEDIFPHIHFPMVTSVLIKFD